MEKDGGGRGEEEQKMDWTKEGRSEPPLYLR